MEAMTIGDKRREAAEQMRDEAEDFRRLGEECDHVWTVDLWDVPALFQDVAHFAGLDGTVRADELFDRMADLIDPTCEVKDDNRLTSDFAYVCRACGEHFSTCDKPNYCPGCGARVVTDDD